MAFDRLHEQRAWWTRAHIGAEVARLIDAPTLEAIEIEVERIVTLCVDLEPDDDPEYAYLDSVRYSSTPFTETEQRVLAAAGEAATVDVDTRVERRLSNDQAAAVRHYCSPPAGRHWWSAPAGAGKSTMLRSVAEKYQHADREAIVLCLSAAAAWVVTEATGMSATTIAAWRVGGVDLPRDGLVVVDEASMVPTLALDQLTRVADVYRSNLVVFGHYARLGAPKPADISATPATGD